MPDDATPLRPNRRFAAIILVAACWAAPAVAGDEDDPGRVRRPSPISTTARTSGRDLPGPVGAKGPTRRPA